MPYACVPMQASAKQLRQRDSSRIIRPPAPMTVNSGRQPQRQIQMIMWLMSRCEDTPKWVLHGAGSSTAEQREFNKSCFLKWMKVCALFILNSALPSIRRVLAECARGAISGAKKQYFIISPTPVVVRTADEPLLTAWAPWQQCTNDALLLHPLIHIVWVVIVGSFLPGKVWGMMRHSSVAQEHKRWATKFLPGAFVETFFVFFVFFLNTLWQCRARVQFVDAQAHVMGSVHSRKYRESQLFCCMWGKRRFNDGKPLAFIPNTIPLYYRCPLSWTCSHSCVKGEQAIRVAVAYLVRVSPATSPPNILWCLALLISAELQVHTCQWRGIKLGECKLQMSWLDKGTQGGPVDQKRKEKESERDWKMKSQLSLVAKCDRMP